MSEQSKRKIGPTCGDPAKGHPDQCHVPKGSTVKEASAEEIAKIRAMLGIGNTSKAKAPEQCHVPAGSTVKKEDPEQLAKLRAMLGITPEPAVSNTLNAAEVLRSLGDTDPNPEDIVFDPKMVQSDEAGKEEFIAEMKRKAPAEPQTEGIKVITQGPYVVTGGIPIKNSMIKSNEKGQSTGWYVGETRDDGQEYALCRCGHSKHYPFCDGSHEHVEWDGTCTASTEPYAKAAKVYKGAGDFCLMDQEDLCAIVRYCDPDGSCWNLIQKADTVDKALIETCSCASGRLTVVKDGKLIEPALEKEIECIDDRPRNHLGPLWVKGGIPVETEDGVKYEVRNRVTLCRCGRSKNKPFCDGEHLACECMDDGSKGPENNGGNK